MNNILKPYFPALTGLRAAAAYLVYFHHFPLSEKYFGQAIHDFCLELYIGVSIFFVLSGFLITIRYYNDFVNKTHNYKKYFVNRFARIYPLFFILTAAVFIYNYFHPSLIEKPDSFITYVLNFTLLKSFFYNYFLSGIAQAWTLTIEETFYLFVPVFFLFRKTINVWLWIPLLLMAGITFTLVFGMNDSNGGLFADPLFTATRTFFGRCFEFFIGIFVALLVINNKNKLQLKSKGTIAIGSITLISVAVCFLIALRPYSMKYDQGLYSYYGILVHNFLLPIPVGLLIFALINENSFIQKIFSLKFVEVLGKSSYAFYLIHLGFIQDFLMKNVHSSPLVTFFILIIISIGVFKFLEEPLNKWIKGLFRNRNVKTV